MKKTLAILAVALLALAAQAQLNYRIIGSLPEDCVGTEVVLTDMNDENEINRAEVKDGRFELVGTVETDLVGKLDLFENENYTDFAYLIVEDGTITVDFKKHRGSGTKQNNVMCEIEEEDLKYLLKLINELNAQPSPENARIENKSFERREMDKKKIMNLAINDVNALGSWALWQAQKYLRKIDDYIELYHNAPEISQKFGPVAEYYNLHCAQRDFLTARTFKDFIISTGTRDGKSVSLSDYVGRGKYVLVDFWSSWCAPCRAETPYLREIYEKYHGDKFDIVGVIICDKREDSYKAIEKDGVVWENIFDVPSSVLEMYGASAIPLIILFDPEGKIVAYKIMGGRIKYEIEKALAE